MKWKSVSDTIAIVVFFATVFMKSLLRSPIEQFPLNNIIQVENKVGGCDVVNGSSQGAFWPRHRNRRKSGYFVF